MSHVVETFRVRSKHRRHPNWNSVEMRPPAVDPWTEAAELNVETDSSIVISLVSLKLFNNDPDTCDMSDKQRHP